MDQGIGSMEALAILYQNPIREVPSFHQIFGGRAQFSAYLTLLALVKNVLLWNLSLEPSCD